MVTQYDSNSSEERSPNGWTKIDEKLPAAGESVLYRTDGHQALGVYEGNNRWRCSNGQVEDGTVLLWQPFYSF
jgi:hypothetical protein